MVIPIDPDNVNWDTEEWWDDPRVKELLATRVKFEQQTVRVDQLQAALDRQLGHCKRHNTFFDDEPCWQCVNEQIAKLGDSQNGNRIATEAAAAPEGSAV